MRPEIQAKIEQLQLQKKRKIEKERSDIFVKFQKMPYSYARKLFGYEKLGLEYEDIVQELNYRLLKAISAFQKKRELFKISNKSYDKPMPVEYYIRTTLNNRINDWVKIISRSGTPIQSDSFDYGFETDTQVDLANNVFVIDGVDIMSNLRGVKKQVFLHYIKGFTKRELKKKFNNVDVDKTIDEQVNLLRSMISTSSNTFFSYSYNQE